MTKLLTQRFNLPLTYANEQGEGVTLAEACSINTESSDVDLNLWQLDGVGSIDAKIAELSGMTTPGANQFSYKPIAHDPTSYELLVWQGVNRFLWLTQQSHVDDKDNLYAIDQTHSKVRVNIHGKLAQALLRRGLQVDISDQAMPQGTCCMTHLEHMGVTVLRLPDVDGDPAYQVWVMRGFAVSLFEFLHHTAATLS